MSEMERLVIDGSVLEGGGQILRNAVAYSALLQRPITIQNIRHNRKQPGLRPQHAAGLGLVADICSAKLIGCNTKSTAVEFTPSSIVTPGAYTADPGTAGSTTLLLQVSYPTLVFSSSSEPSSLTLRGGTNASLAPQIDYTEQIFLPFLRARLGLCPSLTVRKRGYYPKGGGEVQLSIPPVRGPLHAVTLTERGAVKTISGRAYVAGYPARLAHEIRAAAVSTLVDAGIDPGIINLTAVREKDTDAVGRGSGIVLWAETENGCRLGGSSTGLREEDLSSLGRTAAEELVRNIAHGGCVDEYLQDQVIIFLVLAKGRSSIRTGPLTLHTKTAIHIAELLTDAKFTVEDCDDGTSLISCEGIGYSI
ncbi:hypothetical protein PHLGIDRAFT_131317 [Phlebiopsis gigantea 11061_1 CR5-6]|uniref:RNA 3'-terminal phosphate cyclase n=1 Tax=Phlebiopsis gigantea (strain 11061_1 CR5-6) TaxID=745531 RepID=A0A0C3RYJ1_PHLG1|nr:hypothetical protein PHLGIDRAFT_131317 [Phlebiopsis gigantea 11061_1 CR5-6]